MKRVWCLGHGVYSIHNHFLKLYLHLASTNPIPIVVKSQGGSPGNEIQTFKNNGWFKQEITLKAFINVTDHWSSRSLNMLLHGRALFVENSEERKRRALEAEWAITGKTGKTHFMPASFLTNKKKEIMRMAKLSLSESICHNIQRYTGEFHLVVTWNFHLDER